MVTEMTSEYDGNSLHIELWAARAAALEYLENQRQDQLAILSQTFGLIDQCVDAYESLANTDAYARICGLTLLKAKHLAQGAYSLVLDGLGQESGALLRPFIEYVELLTYLRENPAMAARAAENDLPKAGERAKAISGKFKDFRSHLNSHASHSAYSHYSLAHLLTPDTFRFKKLQRTVPEVLDMNVRDFAIQLYLLIHEGVLSLERLSHTSFEVLATQADQLRVDLLQAFGLQTG
jgi:hypothetical protein